MRRISVLLLMVLFVLTTILGSVTLFGCKNKDDKLMEYYNDYVNNVVENNGTPMSYEEWYAVIIGESENGEQNDQGEKGEQGESGLSAYELYKKHHSQYKGSEEEWMNDLVNGKIAESYNTKYNFIYTLATIPPVLSSLDCFKNGYDTYAFIERGKTYNGIDNVDNFYNLGFSTSNNTSNGFTETDFNLVLNKIKELNVYGNETFNIYVQDGTALYASMLIGNASLYKRQYKVTMVEDGTGAYDRLKNLLTDYDSFVKFANGVCYDANLKMSKNDNKFNEYYSIEKAFALATMDNYEFLLQSKTQVESIVTARNDQNLTNIFGFNPNASESEYDLNLRYESISEKVNALDSEQKEAYLNLMYGNAFEGTYSSLTRTTDVKGNAVPTKKLVFIGTRVKGYPAMVTDTNFSGVGALETDVPTYQNLDAKYKNAMIFGSESDYNVLYDELYNDANFDSGLAENVKAEIRKSVFNYYVNYVSTLKFVYAQYGAEYDLIMKGHPREVMDSYLEWGGSYTVTVGGQSYVYDKVMFNSVEKFHNADSIGQRIGLMPYGTAAENLAYIGLDIAIGGLPSSTYTGYETSVDVLFVLNLTNGGITTDDNLKARYELGNLVYHDGEGGEKVTKYYNVGLIYKTIMESTSDPTEKARYEGLLEDWIKAVHNVNDASGYTVDDQGFIIIENI